MAGPLVRRAWRGTAAVVSAMTWGIESPAASSRAGVEPSCRRTGGQEAGSRERGILGDSCDYAWITDNSEVTYRGSCKSWQVGLSEKFVLEPTLPVRSLTRLMGVNFHVLGFF